MDVPEVEEEEPVTLEQCLEARKGLYTSPNGKKVNISPGETILYQYVEDGSITVHPTNTYCQGCPSAFYKGTLADQSLILTQIQFSMLCEVYIRSRGGKTAAKFSRIALPSDCNKQWCLDGPKVYLLDKQVQSCPYKRIRTASLRPEGTSMMISEDLAMLFNTTKKDHVAWLSTFDKRAAGLPEVVSRDMGSDQELIPTLKYLEHQNSLALSDLNNMVERSGCSTWLNIKNDQDYLHPLPREPGLFVCRTGEILREYHCRMIEVPIAEAPICMSGVPVLVHGVKFTVNLDSQVITPHISAQPCNEHYPTW